MDILQIIKGYIPDRNIEGQSPYLNTWISWFNGYVKDFHKYSITRNDGSVIDVRKKTMKMAEKIAKDYGDLLWNSENNKICVDLEDQEKFDNILYENNFDVLFNQMVQKYMALSCAALVIRIENIKVDNEGKMIGKTGIPKIDFVDADKIYFVTIENKVVTECAFLVTNTNYANIIFYLKNDEGYYEIHTLYCPISKDGVIMNYDPSKTVIFKTQMKTPMFFIFTPNVVNNLDINSNLPVSIYANCISNFEALDDKYDGFDQEFLLGKRRVFVGAEATKMVLDHKGNKRIIPTFDPNDMVTFNLPFSDNKPLIQSIADPLRYDAFINGINEELNIISSKVGFGKNYYSMDGNGRPLQTATAVASMNAELLRNVWKQTQVLKIALTKFAYSLMKACNLFTNISFKEYNLNEIKITFDDSIFEDTEAEQARDRTNVVSGLMAAWEFRCKWFGETEEEAKAFINDNLKYVELNQYVPILTQGAITPSIFVDKVYPNATNKEELIAYITDFLQRGNAVSEQDLMNFNEI